MGCLKPSTRHLKTALAATQARPAWRKGGLRKHRDMVALHHRANRKKLGARRYRDHLKSTTFI